jgi:hypothetical protein
VGSFQERLEFWKEKIGADEYVLNIVKEGYRLPVFRVLNGLGIESEIIGVLGTRKLLFWRRFCVLRRQGLWCIASPSRFAVILCLWLFRLSRMGPIRKY